MSPEAFEAACLDLPGASLVIQWGDTRVYKLGPRMFALTGLERPGQPANFMFKASDMAFELLIEHGFARPAPYLARARWVQLAGHDALEDADLQAYLRQAHALVAKRLTRAQRRELGLAVG